MSLLIEIQHDAVSSDTKVSDLLRKCQILAYKLGNEDFKNWISFELMGYPLAADNLPNYRILKNIHSKGHFIGSNGREAKDVNMLLYCLPKEEVDHLSEVKLYENIAVLEGHINSNILALYENWAAPILAMYGRDMYLDMQCINANKIIDINLVKGTLDTIKTKILCFILEIEKLNPQAGEATLGSIPIAQEKLSQIFNYYISGNVGNLASGNSNSNIQLSTNSEIPKEFLELIKKIQELKKEEDNEVLQQLEKIVEELGKNAGQPSYKEKYADLIGLLSDHTTVISSLIMPNLPFLSSFLTN